MTSPELAAEPSTPQTAEEPRSLRLTAIPLMLVSGALVAVQSQVNGALAGEVGGGASGGLTAALVSFGGGLVLLCGGLAGSGSMRRGLRSIRAGVRDGLLRPWQVVGGAAGAFLVATQGFTVATIGVALFTVAVVGGQTASGLLVDHHGVGPSGRQPVSTPRLLGAALTVGAVALSSSQRLGGPDALSAAALALAVLPLVAGAGIAWQQAVNGQVSRTGGPWAATWLNFAVGTTVLTLALVASLLVAGPVGTLPGTWWLYTGGPIGVVFICSAAVLVRVHGVLVLGLCTVCGQVGAALVVDHVVGNGGLGTLSVVGAAVTLLGVLLAGLGPRLRVRSARSGRAGPPGSSQSRPTRPSRPPH